MPLAADHEMVVDRDPERFGGLSDLAGHLDVVVRRFGIAGRMVVHQSTRIQIFLILPRLIRFANSGGIAAWGLFLVRTRDFSRLITTILRRFHSNTLEHGIRILRLVSTVDPSIARSPCRDVAFRQLLESVVLSSGGKTTRLRRSQVSSPILLVSSRHRAIRHMENRERLRWCCNLKITRLGKCKAVEGRCRSVRREAVLAQRSIRAGIAAAGQKFDLLPLERIEARTNSCSGRNLVV